MKRALLSVLFSWSVATTLAAGDWPMWRGRDTLGISDEKGLVAEVDAAAADVVELPAWGNSSPVIIGDRVYLTAQIEDSSLIVIAIDRGTRKIVWQKPVGKGTRKSHELHNMASPSVAAEKGRIVALFGTGDLVCLDPSGDEIWRRQLEKDHGEYRILWGMATSPLILGERVFVACMHGGPSYLLAIDKQTGKDIWKATREHPCVGEAVDSYSTPAIARVGDRAEIVVAGADHVDAYDPISGKRLWVSSGLKIEHEYGRSIASPTFGDGVVVAPSSNFSNLGRVIAVRAGGDGDVSEKRLWDYAKASPDCPTPLIYGGRVYMARDDGVGTCLELASGKVLWTERLFRGDVKASPVGGDGKVYFASVRGEVVILEAGDTLREIARGQLPAKKLIATPALASGALWIRDREQLIVLGGPSS
jgi:outer membrane protein assembly factor BamB